MYRNCTRLEINLLDVVTFSADGTATFSFKDQQLIVTEGVNTTIYPCLVIDNVPEGGVQGIFEIELTISPSSASKWICSKVCRVISLTREGAAVTDPEEGSWGPLTPPFEVNFITRFTDV